MVTDMDVFDRLDAIAAPDLWEEGARRTPGPPVEPHGRRRTAVFVVAGVVAIAGLGLLFTTLPNDQSTPDAAGPGLAASGATYILSDPRIEYPAELREGESVASPRAEVSFAYRWSTAIYPGEAACSVTLFDARGAVTGRSNTGFSALGPSGRVEFQVEVGGDRPVDAEARCQEGQVFVGSEYVFSDLRVEGDHVVGDVAWSAGTPVGTAYCAVLLLPADGDPIVRTFTLATGPGEDQVLTASITPVVPTGTPVEMRCEPFSGPDQSEVAYWLPWDGALEPVEGTVDPASDGGL